MYIEGIAMRGVEEFPMTLASPLKPNFEKIRIPESSCVDYSKSSRLEWLETNGLGSFASGTVSGSNTRRYHGLLVASLHPPVDRFVLLSKVEETMVLDGRRFELSSNQFPFNVNPKGYSLLEQFQLDPFPCWIYAIDGIHLKKTIFMLHGENTTVIRYELLSPSDGFVILAVKPFVSFRDYHGLTSENGSIRRDPLRDELGFLTLHPYEGLPSLNFHHNAMAFTVQPDWYRKFEYLRELERGLDFREDLFTNGYFSFGLNASNPHAFLLATLESKDSITLSHLQALHQEQLDRRMTLSSTLGCTDSFARSLCLAADAFVIRRADGASSVIAGYHWFTDWGRDTMITLPGLTLTTGRFDLARNILTSFLRYCDRGMLPNRFPDKDGEPEFNTVDATLWLFQAIYEYLRVTGDMGFLKDVAFATLEDIVQWHVKGTRYEIHMDADDHLLSAGTSGVQLTWMDARVDDGVVTPRHGKAVEINALWHHALYVMHSFSHQLGQPEKAARFLELANHVKESFNQKFWNPISGCLYDCIQGDICNGQIRPNQLIALSLPTPLVSEERARSILQVVQEKLLTPFGLRSVAPDDPAYRNLYAGNSYQRDSAYHQGTVWPWLLGPYIDGYLFAYGTSSQTVTNLLSLLDPFKRHLQEAMLGSISEIFDPEPPYTPKGCGAQAWSVAELLRVYQKLKNLQPKTA